MTEALLTRNERQRFATAYNFLATSKHAQVDNIKIEAAYALLADLPIVSVEKAAKQLAQHGSKWMPSYGEWYEMADEMAVEHFIQTFEKAAAQLPAARLDEDEAVATQTARKRFVAEYEAAAGQSLPDTHVWKSDAVRVPNYHCSKCRDIGWTTLSCTDSNRCTECDDRGYRLYNHDYVRHCACFALNPSLKAARFRAEKTVQRRERRRA
jgi:hypothetical protein